MRSQGRMPVRKGLADKPVGHLQVQLARAWPSPGDTATTQPPQICWSQSRGRRSPLATTICTPYWYRPRLGSKERETEMQPSPSTKPAAYAQSVASGSPRREPVLGGALQGRLGVQATHEDLQRQRRLLEVGAQQLEVGTRLLDARDREIDRAERAPHVALERLRQWAGRVLAPPGFPDLRGQLQQPGGHRAGHLALVRIRQQPVDRLVERADQPPQPDLGAQSTHVRNHSIANRCSDCKCFRRPWRVKRGGLDKHT